MTRPLTARQSAGRVVSCRADGDLYFELELAFDAEVSAEPGQFCMVAASPCVDPGLDPLLKRPLSILDAAGDRLRFLLKAVGRGTRAMAGLAEGETLDLVGPLGAPFTLAATPAPLLVGGGVGIPPLIFLSRRLSEADIAHRVVFAFGTMRDVPRGLLKRMAAKVEICTLDGTCGFEGNPVAYLAAEADRAPARLQACGPAAMLDALRGIRREGDEMELSLEERMACGIGICRGCAVPVKEGGDWRYATVCREGPVFREESLFRGDLEAPVSGPGCGCSCGEDDDA